MNIAANSFEDHEVDYALKFRRGSSPASTTKNASRRRDNTRRSHKAPQQFNGIHRRRKKKIRW